MFSKETGMPVEEAEKNMAKRNAEKEKLEKGKAVIDYGRKYKRYGFKESVQGYEEAAVAVRNFADTWTGVLGWNTGITGLAKDFVWNYFRQEYFHDRNGPFISSIKRLASLCRDMAGMKPQSRSSRVMPAVNKFVDYGSALFEKEGALKEFFSDLKKMTKMKEIPAVLLTSEKVNFQNLRKAFEFVVRDPKAAEKENPLDDAGWDDEDPDEDDDDEL